MPNSVHLIRAEFGSPVVLPLAVDDRKASTLNGVHRIVPHRPLQQMMRVNATRVVAGVTNDQAFSRKVAVVEQIRNSVSSDINAPELRDAEVAIAVTVSRAVPFPASGIARGNRNF